MTVFRYDKTFEGLLSALFDAYNRRQWPERLIAPGEAAPMFASEVFEAHASREKAARVWAGVEKRLPAQVRSMLMHVWLSEEPGADMLLFRYMRKVFDSHGDVSADFSDDDILEAKKIAHKVSREVLYIIQFVRFSKAGDGTYFAPVNPRCNALPLAIDHFKERFSDQQWLIYDVRRGYGFYYDMREVREVTLLDTENFPAGMLGENLLDGDEKDFRELWKGYFRSMAIKERINPALHRRCLPRRFWKYLPEKG